MKKKIAFCLVIGILFGTGFKTSAQAYQEGNNHLSVGLGIGSSFLGKDFKSSLPPIGLSFDHGISDVMSVGGYLGYSSASFEQTSSSVVWKWDYSYILIGARGSFHFATSDKLDPYAGILLGYSVVSSSVTRPPNYTGPDIAAPSSGGLLLAAHLGTRYLFNDNMGVFGELGYGIAFLQLGATLKF